MHQVPFPEEGRATEDNRYVVNMFRWVFVVLFWGLAQGAFAQAPAQQGGANIPAGLVQKQAFARSLIEDASVAERIQASQDAEAIGLFALAKDSYSSALAAIKDGSFASAEKQLNDAMSAMGKARRRVPDAAALAIKQRAEYEEKLESVESLKKSYLSYLKSAGRKSGAKDGETEESAKLGISRLMEAAKKHATENQMGDALRALEKAEQVMRSAMNRVLGSAVLDYTPKFESPAEEYAYELDRNRSYLELIPVAIAQLKPTDEAKKNVEGLVERNRVAIEQAREYAGKQDYSRALSSIHTGTGYLQLALTAAGLVVSQEPKAEQ